MTSETQQLETTKGILFGAYNAVTGYFQNARTYKNADAKMNSIRRLGTNVWADRFSSLSELYAAQ